MWLIWGTQLLDTLPQQTTTSTPYVGLLPPAHSNLLDKLARNITYTHTGWSHSVRATKAKLIDLSCAAVMRSRGGSAATSVEQIQEDEKENNNNNNNNNTVGKSEGKDIANGSGSGGNGNGGNGEERDRRTRRKPLYRQNSMDFLGEMNGESTLTRFVSFSFSLSLSLYYMIANAKTDSPPASNKPPATIPTAAPPPPHHMGTVVVELGAGHSLLFVVSRWKRGRREEGYRSVLLALVRV